ncbi:MAG: flavin reductase family protein [Anaeroplasma sp.]|uniref:flavin reductase family protein n=1 Tax=Anaeroplasma sp. TaxID=1872523 RepID=UPI002A919BD2|nr:flavin reductase family protein [Anaeroplasma sp.]MDY5983657.1 flavin reductase family protein [Anaeroplasma sp.]
MKEYWKGGNMLYPVPAVLVSVGTMENKNVFTVAWCGTVCTNPPMLYISVRKERYSYPFIVENKEFVVNLTTKDLAFATDYAGVKSGKDTDKFKDLGLTAIESKYVKAPSISESPVNIECKVREIIPLGSHDMILADILGVTIENSYMDDKGKFDLKKANVITYSHGEYYGLGEYLGKFGYSVKKKKK